jgi:hypothetical protein
MRLATERRSGASLGHFARVDVTVCASFDALRAINQRFDFSPAHRHRFRLRFKGLFGSAAAFGLARFCAADRAQ